MALASRGGRMATTQDETIAGLQRTIAELRQERDAALVREAALSSDLQESFEYQTATSDVLKVISRSTFDLQPVLDTLIMTALSLCNASQCEMWRKDGEVFRHAASHGNLPTYREIEERTEIGAGRGTLVGRVALERAPVLITDAWNDPEYEQKEAVYLGRSRSMLGVPLLRDGELIGAFALARTDPVPFTDRQVQLVRAFADQAVIAMENARLITEQREALEQQTATAEVLQVINASPGNLSPVFDSILEKAMEICGASFGGLSTYDGDKFSVIATRGLPPALVDFFRNPYSASPESYFGQIVSGATVLHVRDLADGSLLGAVPLTRPGVGRGRALLEFGNARTGLYMALRREGALVGVLWFYRQEVRPFTDKQLAVLQNFASQAVIAMENARLINEQKEALDQQTATSEVLQVINASPGDLAPVFDAMLEKAMRLCDAAFGLLFTYDGARYQTAAQRGVPVPLAEFRARTPPTGLPGSRSAMLLTITGPHHVLDVTVDDYYRIGGVDDRSIADLGDARTVLYVPLRKDEATLGIIAIYRQEVRAFSNKQIALVENFAAQAVIAIESARLLNEIRQRQQELRVTFENMGDGVAMFDETSRLVAWNHKFQDILDLPDGVLAERLTFAEFNRYLTERGEFGVNADTEDQIRRLTENIAQYRAYERTRPDGRVIEIRHNPVEGGGFVLIYADITERKRNEAEIRAARDGAEEASRTIEAAFRDLKAAQANLIQAEKMASLGQLTAGIAHEIKNPLNFVNNFSALSTELIDELREVLIPQPLGDTVRREVDDITALLKGNLEKVVQHGQRADGIVKAMLDHSRGSSAERRTVHLNAVIDEALNLAYHGARAQDQTFNIKLERDFGESIAPIEVNPQDLTRVFLNIFSNGFYAATRRARNGGDAGFMPMLKVSTRDTGKAVEIRVRDNGTGIPSAIRDKLFQPFFTTKPTGEGTGLGLSITYDIVTKQHGGTITVGSEENEFTEFVVTLPRRMFATEGDRT
jgi:two-component system NtrC family sensor kinase